MASVSIKPALLDITVYGGDAWALRLRLAALGDLTGATIVAAFRPADPESNVDELQVTGSPEDLVDSQFFIGQPTVVQPGRYDITITPAAGSKRTYVKGLIRVDQDYA